MYLRDNSSGWCDFCGKKSTKYVRKMSTSDVDMCRECAVQAVELLTGTKSTVKEDAKPTIHSMFNAIMKRLIDAKTKTLVKAGFLNDSLQLTPTGMDEVNALFLSDNIDKLVEVAEERIKESKEKK